MLKTNVEVHMKHVLKVLVKLKLMIKVIPLK